VYRNDNSGRACVESDPLEGKDPYSASKVGAEAAVAAWRQMSKISGGPRVVAVRAGNVIGGGDWANNRLLPDIVRAKYFSQKIVVRNPKSTRPLQHVLDPLNGYLRALEFMISENIELGGINFGPDGKSLQVHEVIKISLFEDPSENDLIEIISSDLIHEANTLSLDSSFAQSTLGFKPKFSQQEAISMTIKWWEKVIKGENIVSACKYDIMRNLE